MKPADATGSVRFGTTLRCGGRNSQELKQRVTSMCNPSSLTMEQLQFKFQS